MKTIAISIDEPTLAAIDALTCAPVAAGGRRHGGGRLPEGRSRSEIMRQLLQEALARHKKATRESHERRVFATHRAKLKRQAKALIAEQAKP